MKVTEEDLIGELEGIPIEIAQAMVNEQVRQGNVSDVVVFQDSIMTGFNGGGFTWHKSKEGDDFWMSVLCYNEFKLFFEKYPIKTNLKNIQTPSGVNYLILNPQ